jgi:hypothetical protein
LTYLERQKSYGPDKIRSEEAEEAVAEEKIRLKQHVSLGSKGRHNNNVSEHLSSTSVLVRFVLLNFSFLCNA